MYREAETDTKAGRGGRGGKRLKRQISGQGFAKHALARPAHAHHVRAEEKEKEIITTSVKFQFTEKAQKLL